MQQNRSREASLELEIQSLLVLHGSAEQAAEALLKKYESQKIPVAQQEIIASFCLSVGLAKSLIQFFCTQIQNENEIAWGHLAEAVGLTIDPIDAETANVIMAGALAQKASWHLSKSYRLDQFDEALLRERDSHKRAVQEKILYAKQELLLQADTLRSQDLEVEEGKILEKLLRMFPKDHEIKEQSEEHRSRKALKLLDSRTSNPREKNVEELQPENSSEEIAELKVIKESMLEAWQKAHQDPQMGLDFAVAHWMWENFEASHSFIPAASDLNGARWMRAESLLKDRRFAELLSELIEIEKVLADDPEGTFGVSYFRAQALWGMERRFEAIEILEGIVVIRPSYRAAAALLATWKRRKG